MKSKNKGVIALMNIDLIDSVKDVVQKDRTIIIDNGVISLIGKSNETEIPANAEVLNLKGKTVLAGLIDSHLHLSQSGADDFVKPYAESMTKKLKRNALLTLASGVTTVRSMPGGSVNTMYKFRDKVNQGKIVGPRILTSGPALVPSYGYFSLKRFFPPNALAISILSRMFGAHGLSIDVDTQEEAKKMVDKVHSDGVDFIKSITPGAHIPFIEKEEDLIDELVSKGVKLEVIKASMQPDVLKTIVEESHKKGLKVATHTVCWPDGLKEAVIAGVDSIEHTPLGLVDDETFDIMKDKNTFWVPTAYCFYNWSDLIDHPEHYDNDEIKERIPEPFHSIGKKSLDKVREGIVTNSDPIWTRFYAEVKPFKEQYFPISFKRAMEKGIKIVGAVDAGAAGASCVPHGHLYKELELFVDHGMSEFEAIQSVTKNAAELLGLENEVGSIEHGKVADLVILDENPINNISNISRINRVIKHGEIVYINNESNS